MDGLRRYASQAAIDVASVNSLPAYTARPPQTPTRRSQTEHLYQLFTKKKAWATLKLLSNAGSSRSLPTYIEGDKIKGSVTLDLEGDHVQAVSVTVKGSLSAGSTSKDVPIVFFDTTVTLWSKEMGDPRQQGPSGPSRPARFSGKLSGVYNWTFSIPLPSEVFAPVNGTGSGSQISNFRMPGTLLERQTSTSIHYELTATIARSGLRVSSKLQTMIVYVPATRPDPPSALRQLMYQENSPLLGPDADPEGWDCSPPVTVSGTIFSNRSIDISCRLSLAKPLCYTRGSVIPLHLVLTSNDTQALDLLSNPNSIIVRLRRVIHIQSSRRVPDEFAQREMVEVNNPLQECGTAVWWALPISNPAEHSRIRRFGGEIHLWKGLKPTAAICHFRLDYFVTFFPFEASAFSPSSHRPVLQQRVEVATMFARGPKPIVYSPPQYEGDPAPAATTVSATSRQHDPWDFYSTAVHHC